MAKAKEKAAPAPAESAKDAMKRRAAPAKVETPAAKKAGPQNVITLEGAEAVLLEKLCAYSDVADVCGTHVKNYGALVKQIVTKKFLQQWAAAGVRTQNPKIVSKNASLTYTMRNNGWRFKIPANEDGTPKTFEQWAKEQKIPAELVAKILAAKEIEQNEITVIASPDEIEKTNPVLAEKLRDAIMKAAEKWTDDEYNAVVKNQVQVSVKDNFLDRLPGYCKDGVASPEEAYMRLDRMIALTKIGTPGIGNEKASQDLFDEAVKTVSRKERFGSAEEANKTAEGKTADGAYRFKVQGSVLTVMTGNGDVVGNKQCTDHDHACNTMKKLIKEKDYLQETLDEF